MKTKYVVNKKSFDRAMRALRITETELLQVEGAGARILVNGQRDRVARDTGATRLSINSHITESNSMKVVDEVGPETHYGPYLEYGTGIYAESGGGRKGGWAYKDADGNWHFTMGMRPQPFVRPSAIEDFRSVVNAIATAVKLMVKSKWPM